MAVPPGVLFVVASPSGGGKTTLIRNTIPRLAERGLKSHFSVSHTTRDPRPGEVDGQDYHFVAQDTFRQMIGSGTFLEWAEYAGFLYGTSRDEVSSRLRSGEDVFLDIEVQGAKQVKSAIPDVVTVFIYPPSYAELRKRLGRRRQDSPETIERRLRWAVRELSVAGEFDYAIINARLEEAVDAFFGICLAEHHRLRRLRPHLDLISEAFQQELEKDLVT